MKAADGDISEIKTEFGFTAQKLKAKESALKDFCEQTNLHRDRYREQVFAVDTEKKIANFGRSTSSKAVWANKKALTKQKENDIIQEIKDCGIRGNIILGTDNKDVSSFTFDETHINKERSHNVSRAEAEQFIREAKFIEMKWNGTFKNYYSNSGASFVDVKNNNIRTAFKSEEFTDNIVKALEVLEKYGR